MKYFSKRLSSIALTLLTGLATPSFADDTDIYVRQLDTLNKSTRPNVLFMLDNSGSMKNAIRDENGNPTGQLRIDVLKEALIQVVEEVHNVNVGLARFALLNVKNGPPVNAPILFPISYIDGNAADVAGETKDTIVDISVPIGSSADDAEQNVGTGKMILADPTLQLTKVASTAEPTGIKVEKSALEDAVEWLGLGTSQYNKNKLYKSDVILHLGTDPEPVANRNKGDSLVGLRFNQLNIPQGATIEHAELEFSMTRPAEFDSIPLYENDLEILIQGAALDGNDGKTATPVDAAGVNFGDSDFKNASGTTNGYFSGEGYDKKNFPLSGQSVTWKPEKVTEDITLKTHNIAPIIQEIVGRSKTEASPGWSDNNGLVLFLRRSGASIGTRSFFTTDSSGLVPKLRIYWSITKQATYVSGVNKGTTTPTEKRDQAVEVSADISNSGIRLGKGKKGKNWAESVVGIRFQGLAIPQGSQIEAARIIFTNQTGPEPTAGDSTALLNLTIYGDKIGDSGYFGSTDTANSPSTRYTSRNTIESVNWNDVGKTFSDSGDTTANAKAGEKFRTPDLTKILQEIVNQSDWLSGNNATFLFKRNGSATPSSFRRIVAINDNSTTVTTADGATITANTDTLPQLQVTFSAGLPTDGKKKDPNDEKQIIGLRFERVDIPQGAKIVSARINLVSAADNAELSKLLIKAEKIDDAPAFKDEDSNISNRTKTSAEVSWTPDSWRNGVTYSTPELNSIVQEVVNQSGWCGGRGGLAFIISAYGSEEPLRIAKSFDTQPNVAPVLKVEFDAKQISGSGCVNQNFSGQITSETDDAEEKLVAGVETGSVYTGSDNLETGMASDEERLVGFRFREIPLSRQATVLNARLLFIAREKRSGSARFTITGEKSANANTFNTNARDLSSRTKTSSVEWVINEPWEKNGVYYSADIKKIIQEIIQQSEWETYNNLALFINGTGRRDITAFKAGPASAAILQIQVQGNLGESGEGDFMTIRRRLKKIVQKLEIFKSLTPIVDALYESAMYFRGGEVDYGQDRYNLVNYLVSHPGTYQGGKPPSLPKCNVNINPYDKNCAGEKILDSPRAEYISPIETGCQTNHLVLLTDGLATKNTAASKVEQLTKLEQCIESYPDPDDKTKTVEVSTSELCGIDLVEYMKTHDNLTDKEAVTNNIVTHTIGFQLGKAWRTSYELNGKRVIEDDDVYYYENGEEVAEALIPDIKANGYEENPSGTKQNAEAVKYLKEMASRGGGSFYQADSADQLKNAFKSIISQALTTSTSFAAPSVSVSRFNKLFHENEIYYALFKPDQKQRWHGNIKKYFFDTQKGLLDQHGKTAVDGNYISSEATSYWSKPDSKDGNKVTQGGAGENIPAASSRKIYTYLTGTSREEPSPGTNHDIDLSKYSFDSKEWETELGKALFGDKSYTKEDLTKLIRWIRGEDVMGENGEGSSGDRWKFADPLHSSPVSITYGASSDGKPVNRLFVGTNDGLIRMIDATTGQEQWAFLPQELLPIQTELMENQAGQRLYGIDGTPTFRIRDKDKDVTIDPAKDDFVKMYIGMYRGGRNLYALDVTGADAKADKWGMTPKLMWVIKGGVTPFEQLGQTWSSPKPVKVSPDYCVNVNTPDQEDCVVLLFGGGYHPSQDEGGYSSTESKDGGGNAIYMVHGDTGKLLWWASSSTDADLVLKDMIYSIPSDLGLRDADGNGIQDLIYVGDLGGQVWRISIGGTGDDETTGGLLAKISEPQAAAGRRRFFYPPELATIGDDLTVVTIVSGTRPEPLERKVHNRFYAFLETWEQDKDGKLTLHTIKESEMADILNTASATEGDAEETVYLDPNSDYPGGWYLNLQEIPGDDGDESWIGEKGLAKPVIYRNKVFFTTYLPAKPMGEEVCSFDEGKSRIYALDLLTGGAIYDSRAAAVRSGITSDIVLMVSEDGGVRLLTNDPSTASDLPWTNNSGKNKLNCGSGKGMVGCEQLSTTFWRQLIE